MYFSGTEIYFAKYWYFFKYVIWHLMLNLKKGLLKAEKDRGRWPPARVREGDGSLDR